MDKLPSINTVIDFMDLSWNAKPRYKNGRVIAFCSKYYKIFAILNVNGKIYEVSRPRKGAIWKGHQEQIGNYRGTDQWNILLEHNLIPQEYFAPFKTKEKTLARLREAIERKKIIGGYLNFGIEEKCSHILNELYFFNRILNNSNNYSKEELEYLKEIYKNDKEEIDQSECEYVKKQIISRQLYGLYPIDYLTYSKEVKMFSLQEIKKDLCSWLREEIVEKVYNDMYIEWSDHFRERNEKIIDIKKRYNK